VDGARLIGEPASGHVLSATLIALAAIGCRGAAGESTAQGAPAIGGGEPKHGIDVPATWKELPAIAEAMRGGSRGVIGDAEVHAHAWGETARGCYLAVVAIDGNRRDSVAGVIKHLQAALDADLEIGEWTSTPDAEDHAEVGARFTGSGMTGQLRASIVLDGRRIPHTLTAACFYNDRQPGVCENACTPLLAMMSPLEPPPATP